MLCATPDSQCLDAPCLQRRFTYGSGSVYAKLVVSLQTPYCKPSHDFSSNPTTLSFNSRVHFSACVLIVLAHVVKYEYVLVDYIVAWQREDRGQLTV